MTFIKAHQPNIVVHFFDTDGYLAEIDFSLPRQMRLQRAPTMV
jgi:hypothetical protein